jgi:hypothetical protein
MSTGAVKWLDSESDITREKRPSPPNISTSAKLLMVGGIVPLFIKRAPPNMRLGLVAGLSTMGWWKAYYDLRVPVDMNRHEW